ncbi:MAG: Glycosyltransferase [Parcubacteria bacterium C7867-006]|nr:MAG: Glycosyltransferase [Parcubacteria bacterium C7867-006]
MKINYVTNVRIPTTRAQGYAIMKMCSEFANNGCDVELFIPNRVNADKIKEDPYIFYKVNKNFSINRILSTDLLANSGKFGIIFYWIDILSFIFSLKFLTKIRKRGFLYTRDFVIPLFFSKKNNIILELHDIPKSVFLFKFLIRKVSFFVVISNGLKNKLIDFGVDVNKILVSPSGFDPNDLKTDLDKFEARKFLNLPLDKKIVMYIGLLDDWKGYQTLLDASKGLSEGIQVVIIGGEKQQIESLKKIYPNVIFLGFRPYSELSINQVAADVLIVPNSGKFNISKFFTSPLKMFNHMASGVPIIASDLPSIREVANEKNCFFAKPDDSESFRTQIEKVLSDYDFSLKIADQAKSDVKKYTWGNRASEILNNIKINEK